MKNSSIEIFLAELQELGYYYPDINTIYKQKNLASYEVEIILKWIPNIYIEHLGSGDQLVRSLISTEEPFNPEPLIKFFEKNIYNSSVMWGVAHVLAVSNTYDISNWIKNQLLNEHYTFQRSGLLPGIVNKVHFNSSEERIIFLKKIFLKYLPGDYMFKLFKKYGMKSDITFLEKEKAKACKKISDEIEKVITEINRKRVPDMSP